MTVDSYLTRLVIFAFALFSYQNLVAAQTADIATKYDVAKDETTVQLARMKLSGENGKYYSLHSLLSYKYPGQTSRTPEILTFELQTVVKARSLKVDLYVQLLIDGEKVFLSSNRWAEEGVVPGKPWLSEHIALRMPYEVFEKITRAKTFSIQMDNVIFNVTEEVLDQLRKFDAYIRSGN